MKQIQQCPRNSTGNECVGLDSSTCPDPSSDCCVCNYCETKSSGYCPVRAASAEDPPTQADCLSWYSRAGMCDTHMYNDGTFCDLGTNAVALESHEGVCFCNSSNCDVSLDSSSETTLRELCESRTGWSQMHCTDTSTNIILADGSYGVCAFTPDKCHNNPCALLGDEDASCSSVIGQSGNLTATCSCSSGFTQSSYQGMKRPICEKNFCANASSVATSINENSFFFDCIHHKPAVTYSPDEVVSTSVFSYYLGCGVLESNPYYNVTQGCCVWGETCEDCSQCVLFSVPSDSNIVFMSEYAQTHRLTDSSYTCQANSLQMSSYGGPTTCPLGCETGYVSTGNTPSYVCNVTDRDVKQTFQCEPERICVCDKGTCFSPSLSRSLSLSLSLTHTHTHTPQCFS